MEGRPVWDPSVPETLRERMRRTDLIRRRRIAVLDGSADHEYRAIQQAAVDACIRAEAAQAALDAEAAEAAPVVDIVQVFKGELSPDDNNNNDVDLIWLDESVWAPPFRIPNINARVPLPQPLPPEFTPGRGFATYPIRPTLQAPLSTTSSSFSNPPVRALSRAPLQCPHSRQRSPSPECPDTCSPLLMVLHVKPLQFYFPDYLAELTLEEFGRPPYPTYLQSLLTADFLHLLTEPESVSVPPISVEVMPVLASAPDSQESSVVIEWDDQQPLIELIHPSSESAPFPFVPPPIVADSTVMSAPHATARPAPTENEHHLAPTNRLTEQNSTHRAFPEPTPIPRYCLAPFRPPE